jgi:hypothetical protein
MSPISLPNEGMRAPIGAVEYTRLMLAEDPYSCREYSIAGQVQSIFIHQKNIRPKDHSLVTSLSSGPILFSYTGDILSQI